MKSPVSLQNPPLLLVLLACLLLAGCVNLHVHFPPADPSSESPKATTSP